jgi:hypothetical protein
MKERVKNGYNSADSKGFGYGVNTLILQGYLLPISGMHSQHRSPEYPPLD